MGPEKQAQRTEPVLGWELAFGLLREAGQRREPGQQTEIERQRIPGGVWETELRQETELWPEAGLRPGARRREAKGEP